MSFSPTLCLVKTSYLLQLPMLSFFLLLVIILQPMLLLPFLLQPEVMSIELSGNPFGPNFVESFPITGTYDLIHGRLCSISCTPCTPADCISYWHSCLCFAYILSVNHVPISTITGDLVFAIAHACTTSPHTSLHMQHLFDH